MEPSRRDLVRGAVALGLASSPLSGIAEAVDTASPTYIDLERQPDLVRAFGTEDEIPLTKQADGSWTGEGVTVRVQDRIVQLRSAGKVCRIQLRWRADLRKVKLVLGDHWERAYADLGWRTESPNRTLPWYFMAFDGKRTHGYGVMTGPNAMLFWNADSEGITLWADVRSGGVPVRLGDRQLDVCTLVSREGKGGESSFAATQAFCRQMCPNPHLADHPIYGTNDWDYAYGNNSAELIATVSGLVSELSTNTANRPYSVIDDGWSSGGRLGYGPWEGNERFGDMGKFAERLRDLGVRPGLWFRPLTPLPGMSETWRLDREKNYLDASRPEVLAHVGDQLRKFRGWGYEMVKHDFSSWDSLGRWGFQMGPSPTRDGWHFADDTKTTAEIVLALYRTIREAAGPMRILGCNTFGHLAAGLVEIQRIGDDTSGRSWDRTRRMGVNCLAFRAAQHNAFFAADPDIVALTEALPRDLSERWLRLVAESGTALFVSIEPGHVQDRQRAALKEALTIAATPQVVGEPLDWQETEIPRRWKLRGKKEEFAWMGENGAWPFGD